MQGQNSNKLQLQFIPNVSYTRKKIQGSVRETSCMYKKCTKLNKDSTIEPFKIGFYRGWTLNTETLLDCRT